MYSSDFRHQRGIDKTVTTTDCDLRDNPTTVCSYSAIRNGRPIPTTIWPVSMNWTPISILRFTQTIYFRKPFSSHRLTQISTALDMLNSFPKYGMLKDSIWDISSWGLSQIRQQTGRQTMDKVAVTPIQTGFKFERVNNWLVINRKVFFVHLPRTLN